jgi:hypothetical protein
MAPPARALTKRKKKGKKRSAGELCWFRRCNRRHRPGSTWCCDDHALVQLTMLGAGAPINVARSTRSAQGPAQVMAGSTLLDPTKTIFHVPKTAETLAYVEQLAHAELSAPRIGPRTRNYRDERELLGPEPQKATARLLWSWTRTSQQQPLTPLAQFWKEHTNGADTRHTTLLRCEQKPNTPGRHQRIHADVCCTSQPTNPKCRGLTMFVLASDVSTENGPCQVWPGTQHTRVVAKNAMRNLERAGAPCVFLTGERGDVWFMDSALHHRGTGNATCEPRVVYTTILGSVDVVDATSFD